MRARWYDPVTGRFVSEDPCGDGKNWYVYCRNNPVNFTDSSGEFVETLVAETEYGQAVIAAGFGALAALATLLVFREAVQEVCTNIAMSRSHEEDKWHHGQKRRARDELKKRIDDAIEKGEENWDKLRPKYPQRWNRKTRPPEPEEGE